MNPVNRIFVQLLVLLLLFGACINLKQPQNKIEFYTLEYDPPQIAERNPLPLVIRMDRFSVAPTYNSHRIIYRDRSFKRDAYVYYKWRANPGDLVTYFLSRDTKQSGLFKAVLTHDSRFPSSHSLEGSVDEFFQWEMDEIWKAVLTVSITLMAENEPDITKRVLYQKTYRSQEACGEKNPRSLAEAMSGAMSKISGEMIKYIYDCLKDHR